ncbi:hypothetical protein DFH29DRAFT_899985 [Suillus ampliporus]|nr:hypothetical protein DFH29DRAFT_899985 [Suillus ampliporus]
MLSQEIFHPTTMEDATENSTILLGDVTFHSALIPNADASLYRLSSEEAAFFKAQIRRHILEVQAKAYKASHSQRTLHKLQRMVFLRKTSLRLISTMVIHFLGKTFLLTTCCIRAEYLELGHELFRTTSASYPGCLLPGDVFDPAFLSIAELSDDVSPAPAIDLSSLKSLNPLHGRISAINAAKLFHLFDEEKQLHFARALAGLLSAQPGSVICGEQVGTLEKGIVTANISGCVHQLFAHSPQTWSSLWDGEVFEKGSVNVETELVEVMIDEERFFAMRWSVIRL